MNEKQKQLESFKRRNTGDDRKMMSDSGYRIENDRQSLRAGKRGPLMLRDTNFFRKQSRFNRERIPEKVVHARGFGLYGEFELTDSLGEYTIAKFLSVPGTKTPVFTRFSNFIGSKGSKDTAVDIRGFATKFYTTEGNYDMLSLQFPVFILSDAMKFMDVTHAAKPNQTTDIPQATVAHDHFWDYVISNPESAHMVMWLMSMRGRPRSWRMMEGWPINAFRLINKEGKSTFVRFNLKPRLGVHSLLVEEANVIGGLDPDFHRRDIIEAVEKGVFPEYDLGVQLISEEDEFKYDFDVLDATKLWPEEVIPVRKVGVLRLNKLVDNFFAEDEQSSFDPATLVPGIEFSNDPVLQGRAFAYRDTDYHRLGTGNLNEIPVNRPLCHVNTNHRDGYSKYRIDIDEVNYHSNNLADDTPREVPASEGGYTYYPGKVEGHVTREVPSDSFNDHYSQARLFWNSLAPFEQKDLLDSFVFHLQFVKSKDIRKKNVDFWAHVDNDMSDYLAENLGVEKSQVKQVTENKKSPAISMANTPHFAISQKLAIVIGDNFDSNEVFSVIDRLNESQVFYDIISHRLGTIKGNDGRELEASETIKTKAPVLYDSVYLIGGDAANQSEFDLKLNEFYQEAFKHYKPIGLSKMSINHLKLEKYNDAEGVIFSTNNPNFADDLIKAIAKQRFWNRSIYS